jgi:hypothetical protein
MGGDGLKSVRMEQVFVGLLLIAISLSTVPGAGATTSELTLETDKTSYTQGENIRIFGTVKGVVDGTVTIELSSGEWGQRFTAPIVNENYDYTYRISYGNPPVEAENATWSITVRGDGRENSKDITVNMSPMFYWKPSFTSPGPGAKPARGENVTISVLLAENAEVSANSPTGEKISMQRIPGVYSAMYRIKWDDPLGKWSISVEAENIQENKVGGNWINVEIQKAALKIKLLSPTRSRFEVGENVEVRVEVLYPDGSPVENAENVTVNTPIGEILNLAHEGFGIYSTTYALSSQDIGSWSMSVTASDPYGNSGTLSRKIDVVAVVPPGFLAKYWWAILPTIVAIGFASTYVARQGMYARKLKSIQAEMKEIPRLKREAAIKYFRDGTISRSAYDGLIRRYDTRMDTLKKMEKALKAKIKRKPKK